MNDNHGDEKKDRQTDRRKKQTQKDMWSYKERRPNTEKKDEISGEKKNEHTQRDTEREDIHIYTQLHTNAHKEREDEIKIMRER